MLNHFFLSHFTLHSLHHLWCKIYRSLKLVVLIRTFLWGVVSALNLLILVGHSLFSLSINLDRLSPIISFGQGLVSLQSPVKGCPQARWEISLTVPGAEWVVAYAIWVGGRQEGGSYNRDLGGFKKWESSWPNKTAPWAEISVMLLPATAAHQELWHKSKSLGNWRQLFHFQWYSLVLHMIWILELLHVSMSEFGC